MDRVRGYRKVATMGALTLTLLISPPSFPNDFSNPNRIKNKQEQTMPNKNISQAKPKTSSQAPPAKQQQTPEKQRESAAQYQQKRADAYETAKLLRGFVKTLDQETELKILAIFEKYKGDKEFWDKHCIYVHSFGFIYASSDGKIPAHAPDMNQVFFVIRAVADDISSSYIAYLDVERGVSHAYNSQVWWSRVRELASELSSKYGCNKELIYHMANTMTSKLLAIEQQKKAGKEFVEKSQTDSAETEFNATKQKNYTVKQYLTDVGTCVGATACAWIFFGLTAPLGPIGLAAFVGALALTILTIVVIVGGAVTLAMGK